MIDSKSRKLLVVVHYNKLNPSIFLLLLLSLFFLGCQDEDEGSALPDLTIYLDRFEEEARSRGYDFDLSGVEAVYVDEIEVDGKSFCGFGYSNYDDNGLRRIEISTANSCGWMERSDIERENLFFHEIGHAFLNRGHDESLLCDGSPLSIMNSTHPTHGRRVYEETEEEKRAYYISELIDKSTVSDQCVNYKQTWVNDSVFYQFTTEDDAWVLTTWNGAYTGSVSSVDGSPGDRISLALIPGSITDESGRWYRRIDNPNVPECADVTLRVTMNSEQLTGPGAAISIRAFHAPVSKDGARTEEYLFLTTTDSPVSGKLDSYVEELTIPCYSRDTTFIVLFLRLMAGTEGEVSFENIELVVSE